MGLKTVKSTITTDAQTLVEQTGNAGGSIQQANDAANGFVTGSTTTLTGQAWDAARDFVTQTIVPILQGLDAINEAMGEAAGIVSTQADTLVKEKLDEDKLTKAYKEFKAQRDNAANQVDYGHMIDPNAIKQEVDAEQNGQDGMDTVDKELTSLHNYEAMTSNAFDGIADVVSGIRQGLKAIDGQLNGRGELDTKGMNLAWTKGLNKATKKLRDGIQGRLVSMFESMGMTETQAKELADFTKRFHQYAVKQQEEGAPEWKTGRDIAWQYARYLAGMTAQYGGWMWQLAGGVPDTDELNALLAALGYKPSGKDDKGKDTYKIATDLNAAHGNDDGVDFMHEMGALACILNRRPGALVYHGATTGLNPGINPSGLRDDYKEAATWAGDIASGNAPVSDFITDMDVINIDDRIEANPNADPQTIISQYYSDINSGKADRITLFCAHYGGGNADAGRAWLNTHAIQVAYGNIGDDVFFFKDHGYGPGTDESGNPTPGPKSFEALGRFLNLINGKKTS